MAAPTPIPCATNFSAPARDAANRAAHLAQGTSAALTLMHVVPGGALDELRRRFGLGHAHEQLLHDDLRTRLQQLAQELSSAWHLLLGSATQQVLAEGSIDVLIVPAAAA